MADTQLILVGIGVVVAVLGGVWLLSRRGTFDPDTATDPEDRIDEAAQREQDFSLGVSGRLKSWTGPRKWFVVSLIGLLCAIGAGTWHVMRTGSPAQQMVTQEVVVASVAVAGVGGGIKLSNWFDERVGTCTVVYEVEGDTNAVDEFRFLHDDTAVKNGETYITELASGRLLGLFYRRKTVAEDRELRTSAKPNADYVVHRVPTHADVTRDGDIVIETQEDGASHTKKPSSKADVTYRSRRTMSYQEATATRGRVRKMRLRIEQMESELANAHRQLTDAQKTIKNAEYMSKQDFKDEQEAILEQVAQAFEAVNGAMDDDGFDGGSSSRPLLEESDD